MNRGKRMVDLAVHGTGLPPGSLVEADIDSKSGCNSNEGIHPDELLSIENGMQLFQFKKNLRQRRIRNNNVSICDGAEFSDNEEEPYSPDVSEYVPSICNNMDRSPDSENSIDQNGPEVHKTISQPSTSFSHHTINIESNIQENCEPEQETKLTKKRRYPKKSEPGRKRTRKESNWRDKTLKRKKNSGEEFTNKRGKCIKKKEIRPGCKQQCTRKCHDKLTEVTRLNIFHEFWALGDHTKQMEFVHRNAQRMPKKTDTTVSKNNESRRAWSYKYSFTVNNENIFICKTMFLDTLGISDKWITTISRKVDSQQTSCVNLDDRRGHHATRPNKLRDEVKDSVKEHISNIPLVDSHYVRARSNKKYFEDQLTFPKLYKLYNEWMESNRPNMQKATERQYRDIFYTDYNIDFFKPKKDQCPTCDVYMRASDEEKEVLRLDYTIHLGNKFISRELKSMDIQAATAENNVIVACYDLQKILSTPQSEVSAFYYKRKLAVYNFTVFDIVAKEGFCYMWNETIAKKGSNEVSSSLYSFIETKVKQNFKDFRFYSDNCGGQNRNRIVFYMYSYAASTFNIDITHVFLEVGHTQNEGDAMHALIERRKKNQVIYVPEQWTTLVRCAKTTGKPYNVTELTQEFIFNFKYSMDQQQNWKLDNNQQKVNWNKVKCLKIFKENPNIMRLHYDLLSETYCEINIENTNKKLRRTRNSNVTKPNDSTDLMGIPLAYSGPLPISVNKYKDLNSLCLSKAIPHIYHDYYKHLHCGQIHENNLDSDEN